MHWRRFRISEIPLRDADEFHQWLLARWREKDGLLEGFMDSGRFGAGEGGVVEARMGVGSQFEYLKVWAPCALTLVSGWILWGVVALVW